ncbi:MAG: amidase family protein [Pseudomonadota bacterium]
MSSETADIATKSAAEIGRAIGEGRLDPLELTEFYLESAATAFDIYVRLTPRRARRAAAAARDRARRGFRRGPLDGVPISWKDLFDFAGEPTEAGSLLCAGRIAARDATLLARADAAGLVPLGKTHLSELAFSGLGYNPMTATPPNKALPGHVPGGSSSGAAASLTHGLAAAAIGSDTGGSVRIPAAWNGLVGLKTTAGRLPMDGVAPLSPTLDTVGPLTRTVADAALIDAALAAAPTADLRGASLEGRGFAMPLSPVLDDLHPDLAAAFDATLERFRAAGAKIDAVEIPEFAEALQVAATDGAIVNTEGYAVWKDAIEAHPDRIFAQIRERFRSGANYTADQIDRARLRFAALARSYRARLAGYDALLMPTTPNKPPTIETITGDEQAYQRENLAALRLTRLANLFGLCGLTLPTGHAPDGCPTALLLTGAPHEEARLLRLGAAIEALGISS